jgi:hypothetical protein
LLRVSEIPQAASPSRGKCISLYECKSRCRVFGWAIWLSKTFPQGLKSSSVGLGYGTAEAVPLRVLFAFAGEQKQK